VKTFSEHCSQTRPSLTERIANEQLGLLILDGATGTELSARGFDVDRPGWSARALVQSPELLYQIHRDYLEAGAEILTANTFRTHEENLRIWGQQGKSRELVLQAVELARRAAQHRAYVVGSLAPVGDCYSPEATPEKRTLIQSHSELAQYMAEADVDAVLVETHVAHEELQIACEAVCKTGVPLLISFPVTDNQTMLDGTPLGKAIASVAKFSPLAVGVNCLPVEEVEAALNEMNAVSDLPKIIYANTGRLMANGQWKQTKGADPVRHSELARGWFHNKMRILGGCCGTSPVLIAKFTETFQS